MWNKIYAGALAFGVIVMVVLTYFAYSWLKSVTRPADVVANFEFFSGLHWTVLCILSLVLLVLANVVLWLTRRSWSLWATFAFFAFFVLLQTWWLNSAFLNYQKANNLTESTFSLLGLGGTLLCAAVAAGVFFNQFLVLRMRDRMYGASEQPLTEDVPPVDDSPVTDPETTDAEIIEEPPPDEKI